MLKNKKCKIKIFSLFLMFVMSLTFLSTPAQAEEAYRNVDTSEKVYDYADLFTDSEEKTLKQKIDKLVKDYDYDVFIVTINDNNITYQTPDPTLSFLEDFGDYNGFGLSKEDPKYIAFIIDMENRTISVDLTGLQCQKVYSDARVDTILDKCYEYMASEDCIGAAESFLKSVDKYGNKSSGEPVYDEHGKVVDQNVDIKGKLPGAILKGVLTGFIITGIIAIGIILKAKPARRAIEASEYKSGTLHLTRKNDRYVRTYETKVKVQSSSSSGGGGTSSHRSSSGRSHSGGSRKF